MRAIIKIDMDNAAFDEPAVELARILRTLAVQVEWNDAKIKILDINGNVVGEMKLIGKRP